MRSTLAIFIAIPLGLAACSKPKPSKVGTERHPKTEDYPLTTCVVSGEELGSMGKPVVLDHHGTTVMFCCKSCLPEFREDPRQYLTKLKEAKRLAE